MTNYFLNWLTSWVMPVQRSETTLNKAFWSSLNPSWDLMIEKSFCKECSMRLNTKRSESFWTKNPPI